jgi:RNA polymerase sigma-70 factor (sigma-E family)
VVSTSFEQFVVAVTPRLVRAARMLLGNARDAEDMAQETLIVMHRRWSRLRRPDAAEAYALRTLVRLTRRHMRSARHRLEALDMGDGAVFERPVPDAPGRDDDLLAVIRALPARQREAVVLRFYLDQSIADTAQAMRCSPGTVKSQVSKALDTLRNAVTRDPDQISGGT